MLTVFEIRQYPHHKSRCKSHAHKQINGARSTNNGDRELTNPRLVLFLNTV